MKTKKSNRVFVSVIIALIVSEAFILLMLTPGRPRLVTPPKRTGTNNVVESERTVEEMQAFFDTHFAPLLFEVFPRGQFWIPEIQARYNLLVQKMRERYGKEHVVQPRGLYFPASRFRTIGSRIEDGVPTVFIFIPSVMDLHAGEKRAGASSKDSMRSFVVDFMHELDHLAYGYVAESRQDVSIEERINNEKQAWAETCEYTIRPMLETHRATIASRQFAVYQAWVASRRDVNNPKWRSFIEEQYQSF